MDILILENSVTRLNIAVCKEAGDIRYLPAFFIMKKEESQTTLPANPHIEC